MDRLATIDIPLLWEGSFAMVAPTILVVEDEETDVFFLQKAFANHGIANAVQVASHGAQAFDYLRGYGEYADRQAFPIPYLILLDLKLPYMMGLDLLKWIRQQPQLKSTIVLILTSSEDHADIDSAYALGANGYLIKPADADKLGALAQTIKDFWLTHNRWGSAFA